ncbi:copper homeostasis protein CutC [Humibacter soli]
MPKALAVEIAVQDVAGVRIALAEGADRVELCSALGVGGLTPSPGVVERAVQVARDAGRDDFVHVLVRPRGGGFVYSADEIEVMLADVRLLRELGVGGVVVGTLDDRSHVDLVTTSALVDAAGDLHVTYHRAIDVAVDAADAVGALAEVGVRRILTSGASRRAIEGADTLREFARRAVRRIEIMAGGGVSAEQLPTLAEAGVDAVHLSARGTATGFPSGPGGGHPDYDVTDVALVRAAMAARRAIATGQSHGSRYA